MKIHLSRAVTAIGLGVSLWVSSIAALAPRQQHKSQPQGQTQTASSQPGQNSGTATAPEQTASNNKKPLSTGEDPTMIGKRNINKGIWSGGILGARGTEAEGREGRMLAAQGAKD